MNQDELQELIGLWAEGALPEALRAHVEAELAKTPGSADDAASLRETLDRLRGAPSERPNDWFVERALSRLLREHDDAQDVFRKPSPDTHEALTLEF